MMVTETQTAHPSTEVRRGVQWEQRARRKTYCVSDIWQHATRVSRYVSRPTDIASLAAFRILFGLLMSAAMIRFMAKGWVKELYLDPAFHFSYPGFEWIQPWPGQGMYVHFIILALLALCIAAGFLYRVSTILFFLGFTYIELLDQTTYLNHYYLISLLGGLLIFLPAHRAWSLDVWLHPSIHADSVPAWCLNLLRFQVAIVYIFAGLAKLNADWLFRAEPLRIWLAARSDLPFIGPWLDQSWVAYVASWFGAIFDCSIVFFLLSHRTRRWAFIILIGFHVATWLLFNIGMFPWTMIISATLLFPSDWPRHGLSQGILSLPLRLPHALPFNPLPARFIRARPRSRNRNRSPFLLSAVLSRLNSFDLANSRVSLLLSALSLYILVQLALPLRPYFSSSSQPSGWTCSGFNCAWQVMIVEKTGCAEFYAVDAATGAQRRLSLSNYITPRQKMMMAQDPYLIRDMARQLARDLNANTTRPTQIKVTAYASLNGRPSQLLINPDVNLAGALPPNWIIPLRSENQIRLFASSFWFLF